MSETKLTSIKMSLAASFLDSIAPLSPSEYKRVCTAINRFKEDPNHPSLNLHSVKSDRNQRLHTFRGSRDLRVLAIRADAEHWIIQEAGHHDDIYLRATTGAFVVNPDVGVLGFYTAEDAHLGSTSEGSGSAPEENDRGQVLSHWTDSELAEAGFSSADVVVIRSCKGIDEFLDLEIDETLLELAIDLLEITPDEYHNRMQELFTPDDDSGRVIAAVEDFGSSFGFSKFLEPKELESLLSGPIERWMVFLHPAQQMIVDRRYDGPARVGGAAGTGKTVVALHRAAVLARRFREENPRAKVLYTTYIKSLPPVFERLFKQVPGSLSGAVEFTNVDKIAWAICRSHGFQPKIDNDLAGQTLESAFARVAKDGSVLARTGVSAAYVEDEIEAVIKGRLVASLDEYLALERTGRKRPLRQNQRREVWRIYVRYQDDMEKKGLVDFKDVIIKAAEFVAEEKPRYRGVIIDEAQDLSLAALRMLQGLVSSPGGQIPGDGLFLVGDGAQRIYSSCFTLRQAGLEVRGRSTILAINYRNTEQIMAAAIAVAGDREIVDLDREAVRTGSDSKSALPPGPLPRFIKADDAERSIDYLIERIDDLRPTMEVSDVAVLVPTTRVLKAMEMALERKGIQFQSLKDGMPFQRDRLNIGTFHRAKGLEFKAVLLFGLQSFPQRQRSREGDENYADRLDLDRNTLFVAMTRAREVLDLVSIGQPSPMVQEAISTAPFEALEF